MDVHLHPPVGTCYFKSYTVKLTGKNPTVTLIARFYVYVTNVKPTDPDFTAKGGKVYIVVVYNGSIESISTIHMFGLTEGHDLLSCIHQLPVSGSGIKQGDDYLYTINFAQVMSMFNNGGNTPYNFPARYNKTFSLRGYTQSTSQSRWGWSLCMENERLAAPVINGLQIFETDSLAVAKCTLSQFSGFPITINEYEYNLDFSAETMAKAVVGDETVQVDGVFMKGALDVTPGLQNSDQTADIALSEFHRLLAAQST